MNIKDKIIQFPHAIKLCQLLVDYEGETRFIGGCVRDFLSNKNPIDIDLATNLLPEKVEEILTEAKINYFSIGKEFGTITAVIDNKKLEVTTLRQDLKCDGRYAKVKFTDDWQEDAKRRDFTINALSCDLDGNIYDYFNGIADLKQKIVHFIGNPEERIIEDYLRILRFFRFSAYFADDINSDGLNACARHALDLKNISGNRIRSELSKILMSPKALDILDIMVKKNILQQLIPVSSDSIKHLKKLYDIANEFNYQLNEIILLSVFLKEEIEEECSKIIFNFAFENSEKKNINLLLNSNIRSWDYSSLKQYLQQYKENFKSVILFNLVFVSNKDINYDDLGKLFSIRLKDSPITGDDLLKAGVAPGKELGELLIMAEQIWYAQEFNITKANLLKEVLK